MIGDIHGGYKSLMQCLERSKFDYDSDTLISLGDENDGWPETVEVYEELFKIKNLICVMGNHTYWLMQWLMFGATPTIWTTQGGRATIDSYLQHDHKIWIKHREKINKFPYYYVDDKNRCFVHGGVSATISEREADFNFLMWDRALWDNRPVTVKRFKEVYIGHTSIYRSSLVPVKFGNVWIMDTGGGYEGVLSLMDVESKEIFQSDKVSELYGEDYYQKM